MAYIEFNNVKKEYKMGEVTINALNNTNFTVEKGELVVIVGPSGAGKTTTLNILGGMDTATSGQVIVDNKDITKLKGKELIKYRREDIGFVFQFYNLVQNLTAKENVELATQICKDSLDPEEILDMVDEKKIAFRPAVEISYLSQDNQYVLLDVMQFSDITPSLAQAIHMKKLEQEGKLDADKIEELMSQEKPNQIEKLKFNADRFEAEFPKNIKTNHEKEDFIFMCVQEHNQRERAKKRALER